jgi:hypothetical protein
VLFFAFVSRANARFKDYLASRSAAQEALIARADTYVSMGSRTVPGGVAACRIRHATQNAGSLLSPTPRAECCIVW